MKDFYKILGLKENASEEEIRERWIELTKRYHPDLGEGMASDERIREINEAYQVLKHSSTRVEYDLKRTYGQGEREGKRAVNFKRWGALAGILIILVIVGVIYFKNFEINRTDPKNLTNRKDQIDERSPIGKRNQVDPGNKTNQIAQQTQRRIDSTGAKDVVNPTNSTNKTVQTDEPSQKPLVASVPKPVDVRTKQPRVAAATPAARVKPNQTNQSPPRVSTKITIQTDSTNTIDLTTQQLKDVNTPIRQLPGDATGSATQQAQRLNDVKAPITELPNDFITSRSTVATDRINTIDVKLDLAQFKPPSFLATEDEVKKFFNDYIDRYNRMDREGFLSLFSSKAIQNQKEGLEGIRKIYTDFFNEGQEVRLNTQDMKIEIYQNAVEVKARYEIEQIMKKSGERKTWRGPIRWVLIKEDGTLKILSIDYKHEKIPQGKRKGSNETS